MLWIVVALLIVGLAVLHFGFKRRCPCCGKLFAIGQISTPTETNRSIKMGWSINPMVDKDLKFSGLTTSRVPKGTKTIKIRYRCKSCGYEFVQHEQINVNNF